ALVAGAKHLPNGLDLLEIPDRGRGCMGIDVVDRGFYVLERQAHAARRALARWRHHVLAVRRGPVTDDFAIDAGATRLGALKLLPHQPPGAAADDKTVAVGVIGTRGLFGSCVVLRR